MQPAASPHPLRWLAWGLCAGAGLILAADALLTLMFGLTSEAASVELAYSLPIFAYSLLGALIATYQSENRISWLLLAGGPLLALTLLGDDVLRYGYLVMARPPAGLDAFAAFYGLFSNVPGFLLFILLPLWFPTGRFVSAGWRRLGWGAAGLLAAGSLARTFLTATIDLYPAHGIQLVVANPLALPFVPPALARIDWFAVTSLISAASILAAVFSQVMRYRRARGEERQQIKWFVFLASLVLVPYMTLLISQVLFALEFSTSWITVFFQIAGLLSYPAGIGVAVFKYQLYHIDVIIRRTLIYSTLTGLLGLAYFGLIIVLQGVAGALGGARAEWVTVASTLAVAALVAPLRGRVQAFIDRRFYRRKYDAGRTLAAFALAARDETDLHALTEKLAGVVQATMEPESVGVWLRPAPRSPQPAAAPGQEITL